MLARKLSAATIHNISSVACAKKPSIETAKIEMEACHSLSTTFRNQMQENRSSAEKRQMIGTLETVDGDENGSQLRGQIKESAGRPTWFTTSQSSHP